jgi:long-chain acyl-CoA synthetase
MARETLLDFFADFSRQDDVFVVHDDGYRVRTLTYRELRAAAPAMADRLAAAGLQAGDHLLIWSENRPEWLVALWAALLARVVVVPVDFRASAGLVTRIADIVDAKLILRGNEVGELQTARRVVALEEFAAWSPETSTAQPIGTAAPHPSSPAARQPGAPAPAEIIQVIFTSGATADPKGVTITHRNILANITPIEGELPKYRRLIRLFHPIRFLNLLPLSHMFGQSMATFIPPMLGGTVVFSHGYSPTEILRQIKSRRISVLVCVPKVLDVLRAHVERVAPLTREADPLAGRHWIFRWWRYRDVHRMFGWKFWCVVCGAAPLEPELEAFWRKLGFLVVQGYGLTETAPIVTLNHPLRASAGTVGRPMHGVDVKIAADGEILVRGENVTSGYFQRPGAPPADSSAFRDGWFHTGDIGEIDPDGRLLIKGRKKEMIVTPQGLNVFPEDVERALLRQPGVRDAAVVGVRVEGEERVHAVLLLDPGADDRAIVRGANATLEDHQRVWSALRWPGDALPRTEGTQKLKRREIQRWAAGQVTGTPVAAASAGTAGVTVESVLARFIQGREITDATTLEELGLSSLDRVEFLMALEEAFQVTLDESVLTETRTVGELRELLGAGGPRFRGSGIQGASRSAAPLAEGSTGAAPAAGTSFPSWNRSRLSWFLRRISLPTWILPLARYFVDLKVEGLEHLATVAGPVVFAVNHQSHMDTPVAMIAMPPRFRYRVAPAMSKEFFDAHFHPERYTRKQWFTNSLNYYLSCQFFNAFPLPQREAGTRETMRYMGEILADDYSILIYPEGTRHADEGLAPFRSGIGMIGSKLGVPIVPVRIDGLEKVLHPKMKWPVKGPVRVAFGAPLILKGDDYAALARQVQDAVAGL